MASHLRRTIVWLRRDLRISDNTALFFAAQRSAAVACAFVLDPELLASDAVGAPIVSFFFESLERLRVELRGHGSDLVLLEGDAAGELCGLAARLEADALYFNEDYEPAAVQRDARVRARLAGAGVQTEQFIDQVYAGPRDVLQGNGEPYVVFTPYKRKWLEQMAFSRKLPLPSAKLIAGKLLPAAALGEPRALPTPADYGHAVSGDFPGGGEDVGRVVLRQFLAPSGHAGAYADARNVPALDATSHLSPHLRAGTVAIRTALDEALAAKLGRGKAAQIGIDTWISELVWRDFYQQILANFPHVAAGPFRKEYAKIPWRVAEDDFTAWCEGRTGYPLVDAAMRQLNRYGWMHNRLRMVSASFLVKHLLIDWRKGERYFAQHLADADTAANNGGWQWSASTGTDAAPYFRIFNPILQSRNFDADGTFIRRMVPELAKVPPAYIHEPWTMPPLVAEEAGCRIGRDYPEPIVDHAAGRERALAAFSQALGKKR